ncbi:hypothetical protein SAMD00019534_073160 [Acytostelium subglobosum LB1]|uniref:hypothetical protein n=1 Tax=Acytostelium subglobosum LB1 TaxID=1410327 RepID=UPI000644E7D6|nr:hypothetical protein SAMD00019534_073160 [Acytostelium subglobosum LB1]GAM24141.1 hypothetical protein SAMD00019534_073160 [Acytostelium subglobosum LB1]|eukprot:XP_012753177.1 hypothetical protein SAMD00019534_073160 [Acytostelium subglobosum LB1]
MAAHLSSRLSVWLESEVVDDGMEAGQRGSLVGVRGSGLWSTWLATRRRTTEDHGLGAEWEAVVIQDIISLAETEVLDNLATWWTTVQMEIEVRGCGQRGSTPAVSQVGDIGS